MADDRERLIAQLREHGARRRAAEATSAEELERIARLIPAAIEAGIPKREIARLTGVSRPTIDAILSRQ
jgi:DNA invertase Pin-like site-specific DNA recombinase